MNTNLHIPPLLVALSNDIVLFCDGDGKIVESSAVATQRLALTPHRSFTDLMSAMAQKKGARFWEALLGLSIGQTTDPWELSFHCPGTVPLLSSVCGGRLDETHVVIVGALEGPQVSRMYHEVLEINSELVNLVRRLTKEQASLNQQLERLVGSGPKRKKI